MIQSELPMFPSSYRFPTTSTQSTISAAIRRLTVAVEVRRQHVDAVSSLALLIPAAGRRTAVQAVSRSRSACWKQVIRKIQLPSYYINYRQLTIVSVQLRYRNFIHRMLLKDCYWLYHIRRLRYVIQWLLSVSIDFFHSCFDRFVLCRCVLTFCHY